MLLPLGAAVCLLALARTGAGAGDGAAEPEQRSVLEVPRLSEEVRTDGSDDLGFSTEPEPAADSGAGVSRLWGVADTTAHPGRLFVHPIDRHAFHGEVSRYEVSWRAIHGRYTDDTRLMLYVPGWRMVDKLSRKSWLAIYQMKEL